MSNKIAVTSGLVAIATGVVGLVGASLGVFEKFTDKSADPASALKNAPEIIDGYLSGPAFVEAWSKGVLCRDYDAANQTCASTMAIVQRSGTGVRSNEDLSYPIDDGTATADAVVAGVADPVSGYGHIEQVDYTITRTGICASNAVLAQGALAAAPYAISVDSGEYWELSEDATVDYRQALAAEYAAAALGGEQCWRVKRSADGRSLTMQTFIGDVPQPNGQAVYTVLPAGSKPAVVPSASEIAAAAEA